MDKPDDESERDVQAVRDWAMTQTAMMAVAFAESTGDKATAAQLIGGYLAHAAHDPDGAETIAKQIAKGRKMREALDG